jgi:hypothetical protein
MWQLELLDLNMTVIDGNLIAVAEGQMKVMFSFPREETITVAATLRKFCHGLSRK